VARGDEVTLVPTFSGGGQPFYGLDPRVKVRYLADEVGGPAPGRGKRYARRLLALRKMIRQYQPDLVLSFLPNVNIAALIATAFTGIPCIVSERSDPSMQPIGRTWSLACRLLYRFAHAVTVQTDQVAQRIGAIYPGLSQVLVVPNPLPTELEASSRDKSSWAPVDGTRRRVLLSVGRLAPEKCTDRIIDAFAKLAPVHPDWDLHLAGDGPQRATLQRQIDATKLPSSRLRLLGRSSEPWTLMREADAFVMASRYEGFPNALLEAMGTGLPCVATDCPSGPREISRDGTDALLVAPGDSAALEAALARLMGDATLRRDLGERARKSVKERYSLPAVLRTWDAIFASVGVRR